MKLSVAAARREIRRRMEDFARATPEEVGRQMRASAAEIVATMRNLVHDDPELAASTDCGETPPAGPSGMMKAPAAGSGFRIFIWSGSFKAFWARWREFGTAPHSLAGDASVRRGRGQNKGPHHPGTAARPYFWPAWRAHTKAVKRDMRKAYRAVGRRIFGNAKG